MKHQDRLQQKLCVENDLEENVDGQEEEVAVIIKVGGE